MLGITDQSAVELCGSHAPEDIVSFPLGGSIDPQSGSVFVQGTLLRYGQLDSEKKVSFAIVDIEGIHVVVTNQRFAFTEQKDLDKLGIQMTDYKIVVIKLGYLYPEIEKIAGKSILALSPGNAEQRIEKVPYQNVTIPIFPRDQEIFYAAKDFFFAE